MRTTYTLPALLYRFIYWIDTLLGIEFYNGEDASYCGHAYYGHKGKLTTGHYTEVGGEEYHKNWLFTVSYHDEEGYNFQFTPIMVGDRKKGRCFELLIGSNFKLKPYYYKRGSSRTIIDLSWLGFHPTYYGKKTF